MMEKIKLYETMTNDEMLFVAGGYAPLPTRDLKTHASNSATASFSSVNGHYQADYVLDSQTDIDSVDTHWDDSGV